MQEEISHFVSELDSMAKPCAFLHVLSAGTESSSCQPLPSRLPSLPRSSREKVLVKMRNSDYPLSLQQAAELRKMFLHLISLPREAIDIIATATTAQNMSKLWHEEHFGRLTSSLFGEIKKCRQPTNTCTRLLYRTTSQLSSGAIKWGQDNECRARSQYSSQLSPEFCVRRCGIYISESGFLGASPDGLVYSVDNNIAVGIIEIKRQFSAHHSSLHDMCNNSSFFCQKDSTGRIHLRK